MTVGQSPAYDFSVTTSRKLFFLSPFRTLSAIHMQVTDRPSPDAPSLTKENVVEAQWPVGYGVGLRIKRSSVRIRPWPLR